MTNHAAFVYADAPLFLFHLLEFSKKKFRRDVAEVNARRANHGMIDHWSQMVIKHTDDNEDVITDGRHADQNVACAGASIQQLAYSTMTLFKRLAMRP